jgi:hypothetical protein
MHVEDLIGVQRELGFRYEVEGELEHYQWICPPCRRALFTTAQGRAWGRETRVPARGALVAEPRFANPGLDSGPLGVEDRDNLHF